MGVAAGVGVAGVSDAAISGFDGFDFATFFAAC